MKPKSVPAQIPRNVISSLVVVYPIRVQVAVRLQHLLGAYGLQEGLQGCHVQLILHSPAVDAATEDVLQGRQAESGAAGAHAVGAVGLAAGGAVALPGDIVRFYFANF